MAAQDVKNYADENWNQYLESMEDTLADLAGKPTSKDNIFKKVESALSRFLRQKDANGNQYYYESIRVQSARDYENYLKNLLQK